MIKLFNRKKKVDTELAPQLSLADRRALEYPGDPGGLPGATYDEMQRDSMVQTALTIKRLAVIAADYKVVPADGSAGARERADFVLACFERMQGSPLTILQQAMDAFAKGWSVQELVYAEADGRVWLEGARSKDPAHFGLTLNEFGAIEGLTQRMPGQPEALLPAEKFVIYAHRRSYGKAKGVSDLDAVYRHWRAKQALLNAWRAHLERFASPTVLGKYQRGLAPEEQTGILHALQNLHDNTAIVFPNEIDIGLLGSRAGDGASFQDALEFHNREIARAILGQTLTTDEGRRVGSLALGRVHLQVLMLQVDALRRELADQVMTEQVIRPLVELNFGPGLVPRFTFEGSRIEAFVSGKI